MGAGCIFLEDIRSGPANARSTPFTKAPGKVMPANRRTTSNPSLLELLRAVGVHSRKDVDRLIEQIDKIEEERNVTPEQAREILKYIQIYLYTRNWEGQTFVVHHPSMDRSTVDALQRIANKATSFTVASDELVMKRITEDGVYRRVRYSGIDQNDVILFRDRNHRVIGCPERVDLDTLTFHLSEL